MALSYAAIVKRGLAHEKAQIKRESTSSPMTPPTPNEPVPRVLRSGNHRCEGCATEFKCSGRPANSQFCTCEQAIQSIGGGPLKLCFYHSGDCFEQANECGAYLPDDDDDDGPYDDGFYDQF